MKYVKVMDKDGYSATYKSLKLAKEAAKFDFVGTVTLQYNDPKSPCGITWKEYTPHR